jgi:hypothetical protein
MGLNAVWARLLLVFAAAGGLLSCPQAAGADTPAAGTPAADTPAAGTASGRAVVVVRPSSWAPALTAWKQFREAQGHPVLEVDAELGRDGVQRAIRGIAPQHSVHSAERGRHPAERVGYVLLCGDAPPSPTPIAHVVAAPRRDSSVAAGAASTIPTWYRESTAMVKFGGDLWLATDAPYADLDDDEVPDLAIGRIPANSPQELQDTLARTIAYERSLDFGAWRREVRVIAGVGGFGALADSVIEMTTRRFLTDRVPQWANVCMTYASPNSPFCPDPWRFSEATVEQLNAGSLFWVYVGHGHVRHLDYLQVDRQWLCILDDSQLEQLRSASRPPIAVFLACYTGAFDAQADCLAEQMVLHPQGPVAALAATRVTGPYGLATLASAMLEECYEKQTQSLGGMLLAAKRRMLLESDTSGAEPPRTGGTSVEPRDAQMQLITALAGALSPPGHDLLAERREHVWQMNLLGDPLLRVRHPGALGLEPPETAQADAALVIEGAASHAGQLTLQLVRRRDATPAGLFIAKEFTGDPDIRRRMDATYEVANSRLVVECTQDVTQPGKFTCQLNIPADVPPGRYVLRGFLAGEEEWSVGDTLLQIRRPARGSQSSLRDSPE